MMEEVVGVSDSASLSYGSWAAKMQFKNDHATAEFTKTHELYLLPCHCEH